MVRKELKNQSNPVTELIFLPLQGMPVELLNSLYSCSRVFPEFNLFSPNREPIGLISLKIPHKLLPPPFKSSLLEPDTRYHQALLLLSQAARCFTATCRRNTDSWGRSPGSRAAPHRAGSMHWGWKWNCFSLLGLLSHTLLTRVWFLERKQSEEAKPAKTNLRFML